MKALMPKRTVGYEPWTSPGVRCKTCKYFVNPNGCTQIKGKVSGFGGCSGYKRAK